MMIKAIQGSYLNILHFKKVFTLYKISRTYSLLFVCKTSSFQLGIQKSQSQNVKRKLEIYRTEFRRGIQTNEVLRQSNEKKEDSQVTAVTRFSGFSTVENKNKDSFLDMVRLYKDRFRNRQGHVEFIYAALKHMHDFKVVEDLEVYRALIDIMPKGTYVPTNAFQVGFYHYPKHQQCIIDVLDQMERNGVIPDKEMQTLLLNIFGSKGFPLRKFWRMMYWMPKFKNASPWPVPKILPNDLFLLAKMAIERITSVDLQTRIEVYQTCDINDAVDKTWIVSGQSPSQRLLLSQHCPGKPVIVEGGDQIWLRKVAMNYFILRSEAPPAEEPKFLDTDDVSQLRSPMFKVDIKEFRKKTVHEQDDGTIYAVCITGTSSKDSLLSWVRLLQKKDNPVLADVPVLFKFRTGSEDVVTFVDALAKRNAEKPTFKT